MRALLLLWVGSMYISHPFNSWEFLSGVGQSPLIFHWLFYPQYQQFLSTCGVYLEVVFGLNEEQIKSFPTDFDP